MSDFQQGLLWIYAISMVLAAVYATINYDEAAKESARAIREAQLGGDRFIRQVSAAPSAIFVVVCPLINTFIAFCLVMIVIMKVLVWLVHRKR